MRSPRVVYGLVAVVLAVAGFVLPRWLAEQSGPELGETVVVTPSTAGPTKQPPAARPSGPGAGPVSPAPVRTAGDDVDDGPDDPDDDGPDDDG
ncbi:hypothetical protein ACFCV3_17895 [Kribbella sp. NPDC056345]|uniref:hypothetical protein n=1 Tax=Kribbella sp. NPDC056345 TaxID=3345789 RepID=UPI0035DEE815